MTWRERIAAARERGTFSRDDWETWRSTMLCPAAEAARSCGVELASHHKFAEHVSFDRVPRGWRPLWDELGERMGRLIGGNLFTEADSLLDAIEDRALEMKRAGSLAADSSPTPPPQAGEAGEQE